MSNDTPHIGYISGHKAYVMLIASGVVIHIVQAIFFHLANCYVPMVYNVFSCIFYLIMMYLIKLKMYKTCVAAVHSEIIIFAAISTIYCGWSMGTPLYLMAASALVYFCPFERKYIPYIFSVCEASLFITLIVVSFTNKPIYTHIPQSVLNLMLVFNAVCCFSLLLFASFLTNITASVTNQRLLAENKSLSVMANYDFLTGLLSRRAFLEHVSTIKAGSEVVIAMGDLDNFKKINDTYGHSTGDYVLRTFSQLISKHCSNKIICCRWGGEEFIFHFQNMPVQSAKTILQALSNAIAHYPFSFDGHSFNVTITFGLTYGKGNMDDIIAKADSLLYEGKQNGKNQICIYGLKCS